MSFSSQLVKFKRGDGGGSETFTLVPEITNISGPNESAQEIDVTSVDSLSRERIAGVRDGGEIDVEMWWKPNNAQHQGLRTDMINKTVRNFKIEWNDDVTTPTTASFAAIVTGVGLSTGVDAAVSASVKLRVSGVISWSYDAT